MGIIVRSHILVMGIAISVELAIRLCFQLWEVQKALVLEFIATEIFD